MLSKRRQFVILMREETFTNIIFWLGLLITSAEALVFSGLVGNRSLDLSGAIVGSLPLTLSWAVISSFLPIAVSLVAACIVFSSDFARSPDLIRATVGIWSDNEFVLTRAVDRQTLFWARFSTFWLLLLVPMLANLVMATTAPALALAPLGEELSRYLHNLPGAVLQQNGQTLQVPKGNFLMAIWNLALTGLFGSIWLCFFSLVAPLARSAWYVGGALVLIMAGIFGSATVFLPHFETILFSGMKHGHLWLLAGIVLVPVAAAFTKRRFLDQEF